MTPPYDSALILFSHGSVLCGAGQALEQHAARLRAAGAWRRVEVGYMNYSQPTFEAAVAACAVAGSRQIVIAPYFLVPGKFVSVDLPRHVSQQMAVWPQITFSVAQHLGDHAGLAGALLQLAAEALGPDHWRDDLRNAPLWCEANPNCPLYGTASCPATRKQTTVAL